MDYSRYTIKSGDLSEKQLKIICDFNVKCGSRASRPETYSAVSVGFFKGKCFHVSFDN